MNNFKEYFFWGGWLVPFTQTSIMAHLQHLFYQSSLVSIHCHKNAKYFESFHVESGVIQNKYIQIYLFQTIYFLADVIYYTIA